MTAHKTRSLINKTIINSLFTKSSGGTLDPVAALNTLHATQQDNTTYILNGCMIIITGINSFKVSKIKNL